MLTRAANVWRVASSRRFTSGGKEASVAAEMTAARGGSDHLRGPPVVTITESRGGRGYAWQSSASYILDENAVLKRLDLE